MPSFEFEVTKTIQISTIVEIDAKDEEAAENELEKKIKGGLADGVETTCPEGWDVSSDETDYQLR